MSIFNITHTIVFFSHISNPIIKEMRICEAFGGKEGIKKARNQLADPLYNFIFPGRDAGI